MSILLFANIGREPGKGTFSHWAWAYLTHVCVYFLSYPSYFLAIDWNQNL